MDGFVYEQDIVEGGGLSRTQKTAMLWGGFCIIWIVSLVLISELFLIDFLTSPARIRGMMAIIGMIGALVAGAMMYQRRVAWFKKSE